MSLLNIYNELYGKTVATNGDYIAIGNPPSKNWNECEGFGRIGEVILVKKNKFNKNYSVVKTFKNLYNRNIINPYYTEQSSSAVNTSSFIANSGSLSNVNDSCSFLVIEKGSEFVYQSKYGESIDVSDFFLAISDLSYSQSSYPDNFVTKNSVDVYEINPNYFLELSGALSGAITPLNSECDEENLNNYDLPVYPIFTVTGSANESFGKSVSISNNLLAVGAPTAFSGRGAVYVYRYDDVDFKYTLDAVLTSSVIDDPIQKGFGFSLSIDKYYENKILVGSNQISSSKVFLFRYSNKWEVSQKFINITGSNYLYAPETFGNTYQWIPSGSLKKAQVNNNFGHSVSINKNVIVIGAPTELLYYEYSGSNTLRRRGSAYIYANNQCLTGSSNFTLVTKTYGDEKTFKDNMFGYSVSTFDDYILIGSPKPYFPFSSLYLSSSLNKFDKFFDINDFGESSYSGQALLYKLSGSTIRQLTTDPISKRKDYENSYNAFGSSVAVSDKNIVIGAPIPLNDDLYLFSPFITETGSLNDMSYVKTSSYNPENCTDVANVVYFKIEDAVNTTGCNDTLIAICEENDHIQQLKGRCFIYDFNDLQTNYNLGNVFYNNNRVVINNTGSIFSVFTRDPERTDYPYVHMEYESQITLYEKQFVCKVEPGEFNISTNPTALNSYIIDYGIINSQVFNFENLDIILRFINSKLTTTQSEEWWNSIVQGDVEQSIFDFYSSQIKNYTENKLNNDIKCLCMTKDFDVNRDGIVTIQDATAIWKYFIEELTYKNYKNYLSLNSTRNNYDDIINFLNKKTGKFNESIIKKDFFNYQYSSSIDPTGSYLAPYITQVGLYANADLVAVAKLAQPIKNTGEIPINIIVKWDT
jgi:hypothetical protein